MRRLFLYFGLTLQIALGATSWAARPGAVVLRPAGVRSEATRAAQLATGNRRALVTKAETFATDEMRVRVPSGVVGRRVYVTQGGTSGHKPASSLFQAFQAVEAAHAGHASEVHVVLDKETRELYGDDFLSAMFEGLEVSSLGFAGEKGIKHEIALGQSQAKRSSLSKEQILDAPLAVWTGSSHPELGAELAKKLRVPEVHAKRAEDGRLVASPSPGEAAGKRIVLVQTKRMGNSERFHLDLIEMLHTAYKAKQAGAASVMVVSPYLAYSRSDRMDTPGTSVGAAILPQLMKRAGVDNVVFYSVHQAQEVGIFQALHIKVAHASGEGILADSIGAHLRGTTTDTSKLKVLAPDAGAAKRARVFARRLEKSMGMVAGSMEVVIANKERIGTEIRMRFEGNVEGATMVAIDDETASGSTMAEVAKAARANGATAVFGAVSHLTGAAQKKLTGSAVDRLFVLDTLPQAEIKAASGHPIEVVSIADHLSKVVTGLSKGKNVDDLLFFEH